MDPPQCVQNAMMTKDKKPFTYTPGGLNLAEIKSPRMARRIERNANYEGVSETPKPQHPQHVGPLPPLALAAMQPQMHVQVFPSGPPPPQPVRGGAPPPPPQPANIPPPPPPMQPLPTQKVRTAENQVLERPDMTKIIPDNPMALLKKTGGPRPRSMLLDEVYKEPIQTYAPVQQQRSPPIQQQQRAPAQSSSLYQDQRSPPAEQWEAPSPYQPLQQQQQRSQQWEPPSQVSIQNQQQPQRGPVQQWEQPTQVPRSPQQIQQQQQRPVQQWETSFTGQRSPQPQPQQTPPEMVQEQAKWQPPIIERVEQPKTSIRRQESQGSNQDQKKNSALGSLYIPPINNNAQGITSPNKANPPSPPERQPQSPKMQSPSTPTLKEAPKPWQTKKQQQQTQEVPAWAKKDAPNAQENVQDTQQNVNSQQRWPQNRPVSPAPQQKNQSVPRAFPVHIEIQTGPGMGRNVPQQQWAPETQNNGQPNAVYVTQPLVLQHPGPGAFPPNQPTNQQVIRQQKQQQHEQQQWIQQQQKVDAQGARIIPIQIEEANKQARVPVRITTPATPITPGSDRSYNRQQSWGNNPMQSNAFKVIQKMTNTDDDDVDEVQPIEEHSPKFPHNFQQIPADQMRRMKMSDGDRDLMNRFKQVPPGPVNNQTQHSIRTIPIEIEGDDRPIKYVPPSEQTVEEPKKYTGGSIPSRSFKILQAMTAPDSCANAKEANENNENNDPSQFNSWGYPPNYPPPVPPYWQYYYTPPNFPTSEYDTSETDPKANSRKTPVPFWTYPSRPTTPYFMGRPVITPTTDVESSNSSRNTPLPFYGYPRFHAPPENDNQDTCEEVNGYLNYPPYAPYFDPYYYPYYYGYPPMYPPYMYPNGQGDDLNGYSSMDEMAYYNQNAKDSGAFDNMSSSTTPTIVITPSLTKEDTYSCDPDDSRTEAALSDSDTEVESEGSDTKVRTTAGGLQAIRSVKDINVYKDVEDSDGEPIVEEEDNSTDESDDDSVDSIYINDDETIPHQLSVIFEVSERSESRQLRECSVLSDCTTVGEQSEVDYEDFDGICKNFYKTEDASTNILPQTPRTMLPKLELNLNHEIYDTNLSKNLSNTKQNPPSIHEMMGFGCSNSDENSLNSPNIRHNKKQRTDFIAETESIIFTLNCSSNTSKQSKEQFLLKRLHSEANEDVEQVSAIETKETTSEEKVEGGKTKCGFITIRSKNIDNKSISHDAGIPIEAELVPSFIANKSDNNEEKREIPETEKLTDTTETSDSKEESDGEDWWSIIAKDEDILPVKKNILVDRETIYVQSIPDDSEPDATEECYVSSINGIEETIDVSRIIEEDIKGEEEKIVVVIENESRDEDEQTEEIDFWSVIQSEEPTSKCLDVVSEENDDASSTSSRNSSCSVKPASEKLDLTNSHKGESISSSSSSSEEESEDSDSDDSEEHNHQVSDVNNNDEVKQISIKDRIKALQASILARQSLNKGEEEIKICVKEKIQSIEINKLNKSTVVSAKSSIKSFSEYSEEDVDSGVTSDLSRHISDNEDFPELRKMSRYQRAATHSRLFKLLQEECDEEDEEYEVKVNETDITNRKGLLSLKLTNVNEPEDTVNEKLVDELVHSMLKQKKGEIFRNMSMDKLHAAAKKILQEDGDSIDTPSGCSEFLSPLKNDTGNSTAAQTPQEFDGNCNDYYQYYESWNDAQMYDNYDILPSKAFKLIQDHAGSNKTGVITGLMAKCPRVLSAKNIQKELMKLVEYPENSTPTPEQSLESNDAMSAS